MQTLCRAEEAFVVALGPPVAGRLGRLPTIRELLWVLERLDRYGSFGQGAPGAGLSVLEGLLEGHAWAVRWEGAKAPAHLGYFVPALRDIARRWKHTWAPRIKDQRIAEGRREPRRAAGRPGAGPVLGYDPKKARPAPRRRRQRRKGAYS
jgi:hypothetical protein